jgi:oligopeptide/dipeptide ABC transporter ATP-binding protein
MNVIDPPLLAVRDLSVEMPDGTRLVYDVDFEIRRGETLALVGESGCGKSVTALAIMGLLPTGLTYGGGASITLEGTELLTLSEASRNRLRGNRLAMIFQDPLTALNPVMSIGSQITEVLRAHRQISSTAARARALELLAQVRIPDPAMTLRDFPHRLSGGMRQRVMIAMALACEPAVLVADEPTTALDVTVQAQILDLLRDLQKDGGLGIVFITHDLALMGEYADRSVVMYAGTMVEAGATGEVLAHPRHRYTEGLLRARPNGNFWQTGTVLTDIPGNVPAPRQRPAGCGFAGRCAHSLPKCMSERPPVSAAPAHWVKCFNATTENIS